MVKYKLPFSFYNVWAVWFETHPTFNTAPCWEHNVKSTLQALADLYLECLLIQLETSEYKRSNFTWFIEVSNVMTGCSSSE